MLWPRLGGAYEDFVELTGAQHGPASGFTGGAINHVDKGASADHRHPLPRSVRDGVLRWATDRLSPCRLCGAREHRTGARGCAGHAGRLEVDGRRHQGADRIRSGRSADDDPLHEPPERDPAGHLVLRPPPNPAVGHPRPEAGRRPVMTTGRRVSGGAVTSAGSSPAASRAIAIRPLRRLRPGCQPHRRLSRRRTRSGSRAGTPARAHA